MAFLTLSLSGVTTGIVGLASSGVDSRHDSAAESVGRQHALAQLALKSGPAGRAKSGARQDKRGDGVAAVVNGELVLSTCTLTWRQTNFNSRLRSPSQYGWLSDVIAGSGF